MLYIGIPSHNEATTVGVLLWRLRTVLADVSREYEVIVYDDASTDGTADVLAPYARVLPLTLLRGERRVGTGGALDAIVRHVVRTTRYPRRDALLCMQADFTDSPTLVPEFLRRFEGGADLIIGERRPTPEAPTTVRRLLTAARWVLRPFVGITDVRDLTTSFRLARVAVLRDLLKAVNDAPVCSGDGWTAQAELLLKAAPHARRIETIPVTPTFGVRTRDTRRQAWPDTVALARWAWAHRGLRVEAKVIARDVDQGNEPSEVAEALEEDRLARAERGERTDPRREPATESRRRGRADRTEARARTEDPASATREDAPSREQEGRDDRTSRRERGAKRERPSRERRGTADTTAVERAPQLDRVAPTSPPSPERAAVDEDGSESDDAKRRRRRRGRRGRGGALDRESGDEASMNASLASETLRTDEVASDDADDAPNEGAEAETGDANERTRRKRRTRRGRRRGERNTSERTEDGGSADAGAADAASEDAGGREEADPSEDGERASGARRRRNRRGRRGGRRRTGPGGETAGPSDGGSPSSDD